MRTLEQLYGNHITHTCTVLGSKNVISSKFTNNFEQKCHSYQRPFTLSDQSVTSDNDLGTFSLLTIQY